MCPFLPHPRCRRRDPQSRCCRDQAEHNIKTLEERASKAEELAAVAEDLQPLLEEKEAAPTAALAVMMHSSTAVAIGTPPCLSCILSAHVQPPRQQGKMLYAQTLMRQRAPLASLRSGAVCRGSAPSRDAGGVWVGQEFAARFVSAPPHGEEAEPGMG